MRQDAIHPQDLTLSGSQPVINAPRMQLRPMRGSDAGLMAMYGADKRVADMTTSIPHPLPPGAVEAYITSVTKAERTEYAWAMDSTSLGGSELLGVISLEQMDRGQSEIGYWVAPAFWKKGLASEAVQAIVAANPLENTTMFASVFQDNPVSARILTNSGFQYLGDAEAFSVARAAPVPTWTYLKRY